MEYWILFAILPFFPAAISSLKSGTIEVAKAVAIATGTIIMILYFPVNTPQSAATSSSSIFAAIGIKLLNNAPSNVVDILKIIELKIMGADVHNNFLAISA